MTQKEANRGQGSDKKDTSPFPQHVDTLPKLAEEYFQLDEGDTPLLKEVLAKFVGEGGELSELEDFEVGGEYSDWLVYELKREANTIVLAFPRPEDSNSSIRLYVTEGEIPERSLNILVTRMAMSLGHAHHMAPR